MTPTNTMTPTGTIPSLVIPCNCLTFRNTVDSIFPIEYTDCRGNRIYRNINGLQTITVCGTDPFSVKEVDIKIGVCDKTCNIDCFQYIIRTVGEESCLFEFTPCCDTIIKSPYLLEPKEGFVVVYSTTYPVIISGNGFIEVTNILCNPCKLYNVFSRKRGSKISFKPCCDEIKTSPYVVTEVDEINGFSICSSTIPTSNSTSGTIELTGKCPSC
jgi:hypothetical protein